MHGKILLPDLRGRMGDFIRIIQKSFEQKIISPIRKQKSVDFQLFETLKIIKRKCEIDRSYHSPPPHFAVIHASYQARSF
jgi:hypothetical protein